MEEEESAVVILDVPGVSRKRIPPFFGMLCLWLWWCPTPLARIGEPGGKLFEFCDFVLVSGAFIVRHSTCNRNSLTLRIEK
mmetsp:Transcript_8241/g.12631  ORF Transcript_8241/g.12631 Transcript_8241/m.12631 type:complete len:81 (-) Transcript_8241:251-493(-)